MTTNLLATFTSLWPHLLFLAAFLVIAFRCEARAIRAEAAATEAKRAAVTASAAANINADWKG